MIKINFEKEIGKVKPLHSINNGPLSWDGTIDTSEYYKEIGIPYIRLHDTDYPSPKIVDIPKIFPNFDADPDDESNYFFEQTDQTIEAIINVGAKVLYRLGTSIEHTKVKRFVVPPKDYEQWSKICIGIIKHYNEGWANGFHYGIKYWEIWNEPDNDTQMWVGGSAEDYYRLYATSTKIIKAYDKSLKLGGYAACVFDYNNADDYYKSFLKYCKKENAPLDFFSWHIYSDSIELLENHSRYIKDELINYGFENAEIFLDEWNYFDSDWVKLRSPGGEYARQDYFEKLKGQLGAAFATASMIKMQSLPIDIAYYYDGQPKMEWCGLFDYYGVPKKPFYAFKAFGKLYIDQTIVESTCEIDKMYCLATKNYALIVNLGAKAGHYTVDLENLSGKKVEMYIVDSENNLDLLRTEYFHGYRVKQSIYMEENAIVLLKISEMEK